MILNVVKYSSAFITVLFGFHFLKTERERILLLLKEKDDELLNCDKRINILEKELINEKNKYNALIRLLPQELEKEREEMESEPSPAPSPEPTRYNSLDKYEEDKDKNLDLILDTDNTNYDNDIINDLHNDNSEDSIEELIHSNDNNDDSNNDEEINNDRGVIEFTE